MEDIISQILDKLGKHEMQIHYLNEFIENTLLVRISQLEKYNNPLIKKDN